MHIHSMPVTPYLRRSVRDGCRVSKRTICSLAQWGAEDYCYLVELLKTRRSLKRGCLARAQIDQLIYDLLAKNGVVAWHTQQHLWDSKRSSD
jgi:hypothetical protein